MVKVFERNPISQRYHGLPESFTIGLKVLLRALDQDEIAGNITLEGDSHAHFRAKGTWKRFSLQTNKRTISLLNTGEIVEESLPKK